MSSGPLSPQSVEFNIRHDLLRRRGRRLIRLRCCAVGPNQNAILCVRGPGGSSRALDRHSSRQLGSWTQDQFGVDEHFHGRRLKTPAKCCCIGRGPPAFVEAEPAGPPRTGRSLRCDQVGGPCQATRRGGATGLFPIRSQRRDGRLSLETIFAPARHQLEA